MQHSDRTGVLLLALLAALAGLPLPATAEDEPAPVPLQDDAGAGSDPGDEDASEDEDESEDEDASEVEVEDALLSLQWYLRRINAPEAWEVTRGSPEVTVAIVDTGVDPLHEDVAPALGIDPVSGGFGLDLFRGSTVPYYTAAEDWHGTAIAGLVAAREGDGYGIVGVAPEVSVEIYKIYGSPDELTPPVLRGGYDPAVTAIETAVADGADVILLPWGGQDPSPSLRSAIEAAGVPVVAAAGNDGADLSDPDEPLTRYPAMYRLNNLVTVTATDQADEIWDGDDRAAANIGVRHVALAAPGDVIVAPWAGEDHRLHAGTSFAAPQVAGALALAKSIAPRTDTNRLVSELLRTARPVDGLAEQVTSGGVLDVAAFLAAIERPVCTDDLPAAEYQDVVADSTHAIGIDCVTAFGLSEGRGEDRFDPAGPVTRGQMASFLARLLARAGALTDPASLPAPTSETAAFPDSVGSVHAAAIEAIAPLGIAQGFTDGTFRPGTTVDRGQMAAFLVRTYEHLTTAVLASDRQWFDDTVGTTHEAAITAARELGITFGTDQPRSYAPARTLTREQMATFLARTLDALGREGVEVRRP
ncbi:MAG: S8 family serine peptidase [Nitriliruptoraceae bacterium]